MKNFIFKSTDADFKKMFSIIETIQKNVLYLTYRIDLLVKEMKVLTVDKGLQKQVDEYFNDEDNQNITPEEKQDLDWVSLRQSYVLVYTVPEDTYTKVYVNKTELLIIPIEKLAYTTVELYVVLNTD